MRSKQAMKNLISNLMLQIIVFISGIILPKFFLEAYGSSVNGMVTSISQFLSYLGLAEAGVGSASIVALYLPLAEKRQDEVNSILSATRIFYNRSGIIFLSLVIILTGIYPYLISQQLPNTTVRMMVLILASSTLVDYFFLGKYKVILTAMQRGYVVAIAQMIGTIVNTSISIILISFRVDIVIVKFVATGAYILRFFVVRWYVRKNIEGLSYTVEPNFGALKQRGAALLHQIVGIIVNNTDIVILTVFLGSESLIEVSVYSIYNMIVYAIYTLLNVFANGLTAGFGEVISKDEEKVLKASYSSFEYMYYMIFYIVCICVAVLLLPFVCVYTQNVKDAEYVRPIAAILFVLIIFLQNIRIPGLTMICAAGHYKETRLQAIMEAVINLTVSLILVSRFKMLGLLFGTVCSYGYRSMEVMFYNHKYIVKGCGKQTVSRIFRNLLVSLLIIVIGYNIIPTNIYSYVVWFKYAVAIGGTSCFCIFIVNYFFEPREFENLLNRVKNIFGR